jgi:gliding motility-associated-like protein
MTSDRTMMKIRYALCVLSLAFSMVAFAQPFNNEPCQAIPLSFSSACNYQQFNNTGATNNTNGIPNPGCGGYNNNQAQDVWFVVQVPPSGTLNIDQSAGSLNNTSMAAYTASTCAGPFTLIACDADASGNGNMPRLELTGLTPGSLLFLRVWDFYEAGFLGIGSDPSQQGTFGICAQQPEVIVIGGPGTITYDCGTTPPAGNTCDSSSPICTFDGYCGSTSGYTADFWDALGGGGGLFDPPGLFCGSIENNSFVSFIAGASSVELEVIVSGSSSACDEGIQIMMFADPSGITCGSPAIVDYGCQSPMAPGTNEFVGNNLVPGVEYYMMVDGFAGDDCTYQINAVSGVVIDVSAGPDRSICLGQSVSLNVVGNGTGPVSWTGPGLNTTVGETVIATPTSAGTFEYIVYATDALIPECNGDLTDTVLVNVAPSVPVSVVQGACVNGSIPLTASGAGLYTWTPPTNINQTSGSSVSVTPTVATVYTVSGSTPGGCIISTNITVNPCDPNCIPPVFTITPPAAVCAPATVDLTSTVSGVGTNTVSYHADATSANTGAPALPSSVVSTSGTYYVRVQIANNPTCFTVLPVQVTIVAPGSVSAGADLGICAGASTTLTATGATTYTWSPATGLSATSGASVLADPAATTTYTVTGTTNSCSSTATVTVTVSALPVIAPTLVQPTCGASNGSISLQVTGGNANFNFVWTPTGSTASISELAAGTYDVTVSNIATGCTSTATYVLTSAAGPDIVSTTLVDPTCGASDGGITVNANGGVAPLEYSIDGGLTFQASGVFAGLPVGSYDVVVSDANSCTAASVVSLSSAAAPTISATNTVAPGCGLSDGSIDITAQGGVGVLEYSVDGGTTFQATGAFPGLPAGTYSVVVRDSNGCAATASVPLLSEAGPAIDAVNTVAPTCVGGDGEISIVASGGSGALEYSIDGGATFQASGVFTGLSAGNYDVVVRDAGGCEIDQPTILSNPNAPAVQSINITSPACGTSEGGLVVVATGGTAPYDYSIDNGGTFQPFATFGGLPVGTYDVVVRDALGCETTDQATIVPLPILTQVSDTICNGESLFVGGAAQTVSGSYVDTYPSALGCDSIVTTVLLVQALPPAGFTVTPLTAPVAEPNFVVLNGAGSSVVEWSYDWGDGTVTTEPSGEHTYPGAGRYIITQTVTTANGCTSTFTITVSVRDDFRFYIPNAFTPDGDGVNDVFLGYGSGVAEWEMFIFDRWGEMIHSSKDMDAPWDGKSKGVDSQQGVYPYIFKVVDVQGFNYEFKGHVTLTR